MPTKGETRIRVTVSVVREEYNGRAWSSRYVVNREVVAAERDAFRPGREDFGLDEFRDAVQRVRDG